MPNEPLSEWELPAEPSPVARRRSLDYESPLRGDFTDLSAPVPMASEAATAQPLEPVRASRGAESSLEATSRSSGRLSAQRHDRALESQRTREPASTGSSGIGPRRFMEHEIWQPQRKDQRVDLGLDESSTRMLAQGVPEGSALPEEYMKHRDLHESQWIHAKHSMAPIPPLGSWEAEDKAARRVADILTMPVQGPSPIYKGRSIKLFTHDEKEYFDKYPRDAKNYNKFIWSLCKNNDYPAARKALEAMKEHGIARDVGIYTSLMQGCIATKDPREAMRVFVEMRNEGIAPDLWVFDTLMEVFVVSGELDGAFALYDELKPHGLKPSTIIFTTLVKGCLRDNDTDRAWKVFNHMRVWHCEPDEVMMSLMIHACAKNSEAERAMNLFDQMRTMGMRPTQYTWASLMHAFARRKDYYTQVRSTFLLALLPFKQSSSNFTNNSCFFSVPYGYFLVPTVV